MKKLLMLGTSKASCEMIEYAKSQGIYTIVTDYLAPEKSKAKLIADEYWMISTGDFDTLEKKCREEHIDGVCSGISTFCIPATMELCKRLGLQAYCTPESWHYTMNKYDFKALCRSCNVPVATDYFVSNPPTEEELSNIKFPAYYALVKGEASLVSLFSDLAQPGTPNNCYAVNSTACDKLDVYLKEVDPYFRQALKLGGMKDGVCWIELILDEDGHFYVIEMGYRMSGDMMAIPIKDVTGFNSYKWLVDYALGAKYTVNDLPVSQTKLYEDCGCAYILWSTNKQGKIHHIEGLDEILAEEGVHLAPNVYNGDNFVAHQYLLTFTFTGKDVDYVCNQIDKINKTIKVIDEDGEDVAMRFTDFDELRRIYYCK